MTWLKCRVIVLVCLWCVYEVASESEPRFVCDADKFKCLSEQCIPLKYVCDKMDDCGDGSDEISCPATTCNPKSEFRCQESGRCLPLQWRCDGDYDCGDKSDEVGCPKTTCAPDFFQCNNTRCIPKRWVCDQTDDCGDSSDETCGIQPKTCQTYQFTCKDGSCISKAWKCDGDSDCLDGSDEKDCPVVNATCAGHEFQCGRQCLPMKWRCDGNEDCHPNGEDEKGCDVLPTLPTCSADKWQCKSGDCISNVWRCDGEIDCVDRSDEENCQKITCSADKFACSNEKECVFSSRRCDGKNDCSDGSDELNCPKPKVSCTGDHFNCSDGTCIQASQVCDMKLDCPKGEDEPVNCFINECLSHKGHCMHKCVDLNIGFKCECNPGYALTEDKKSCQDIDECQIHGSCHQNCENVKGSFKCSCADGYQLEPDRRTCKATDGKPIIYFSNRQDIRTLSMDGEDYSIAIERLKGVISFDFDVKNKHIYMADAIDETIKRAKINDHTYSVETVVRNVHTPDGLAVDWIGGKLYWTDTGYKTIEVSDMDGKHNQDLVSIGLDEPRAIALDPHNGFLYWTDWGETSSSIERMSMDGALETREKVVADNIQWPNGLTLDLIQKKMYWIDAKLRLIEVADLNGKNRKILTNSGIAHPFALDNFNDRLIWTDWRLNGVRSINKFNNTGVETLRGNLIAPMGIKVYHPTRQLQGENPCGTNNSGCSHLCLLGNRKGTRIVSCACPRNMTLTDDRKTCHGIHLTRPPPTITDLPTTPKTTHSSKPIATSPSQSTKAKLPTTQKKTPTKERETSSTSGSTSNQPTTHPLTRPQSNQPSPISNAQTGGREGKPLSSGVIVAISVTIFVALLLLVLCVLYFKRKTIGKRHVMYYKDMSSTPLEEDFDIQQDDFSEKAKIIYEES